MPLDIAAALASTFATTDVQHGRTKSVQTREVHELAKAVISSVEGETSSAGNRASIIMEEKEVGAAAIGQFSAFGAAPQLSAPLAPLAASLRPAGSAAAASAGLEMKTDTGGAFGSEREMISQLKEATPDGGQRTGGHRGSVAMAEVAIERGDQGRDQGRLRSASRRPLDSPAAEARRRSAPRRAVGATATEGGGQGRRRA